MPKFHDGWGWVNLKKQHKKKPHKKKPHSAGESFSVDVLTNQSGNTLYRCSDCGATTIIPIQKIQQNPTLFPHKKDCKSIGKYPVVSYD